MNILITGGASGLGEAITRNLASGKNKVYFTYCSSLFKAGELEKEFSNTKGIHCDFSDESSVSSLLTEMENLDLDVLVNNALTGLQTNYFHKIESAYYLESFKNNILPVIRITQQAILQFRKKKTGKIITVLSNYLIGRPPIGVSAYVAEKNYLLSLSNSWAAENLKFNIASNCISPSFMLTGLTADTDERVIEEMINNRPDKKLLTPQEAAIGVAHIINSPAEVTGTNLVINSISDIR